MQVTKAKNPRLSVYVIVAVFGVKQDTCNISLKKHTTHLSYVFEYDYYIVYACVHLIKNPNLMIKNSFIKTLVV